MGLLYLKKFRVGVKGRKWILITDGEDLFYTPNEDIRSLSHPPDSQVIARDAQLLEWGQIDSSITKFLWSMRRNL